MATSPAAGNRQADAAAPPAAKQPARRRRFAPRFSLTAALIALTLASVGLWYWYRVPYEVVLHHPNDETTSMWVLRRWGGETVLHGPRRIFHNGQLTSLKTYREGVPHGPWEWRTDQGELFLSAVYDRGRVVSATPAADCDERLAELIAADAIDNRRIRNSLFFPAVAHFVENPLRDVVAILRDTHSIPIVLNVLNVYDEIHLPPPIPTEAIPLGNNLVLRLPLDPDAPDELINVEVTDDPAAEVQPPPPVRFLRRDTPITCEVRGVPLIVVIGRILKPHGLVCDYRYGMLWITEQERAGQEPTGVSKLVPPPGSKLAATWERQTQFDFIETPLPDALTIIADFHEVRFDASRLPPEMLATGGRGTTVTLSARGIPFKHALGFFLDNIHCRARLDGETIVLERQPAE